MPNLSDLFTAGGFLKWDGAGNADADYSSQTPTQLAADAAFTDAFAAKDTAQSGAVARVFEVTSGAADALFSVDVNDWPNSGGGAGTDNHTVHIGFNAGRHSGGSVTANMPAVYFGMEDDYFDAAGDLQHGAEWYFGYATPDGTTLGIADYRPFYFRIIDSSTNTVDKDTIAYVDIGSGGDGYFTVMGSVLDQTELFTVRHGTVTSRTQLHVLPPAGNATFVVGSATGTNGTSTAQFNVNGSGVFRWTADNFSEIFLFDMIQSRYHAVFISGATTAAAMTDIRSSLKVQGNVGFYDTTPVAKPTGVAVTAAGIHAALVTLGLIAA